MTMRMIVCFMLLAFTAWAQLDYYRSTVGPQGGTTTLAANTNATYNSAADVGPGVWADVQIVYRLATNSTATNNVVLSMDRGIDNAYWRDSLSLTSAANGTNMVSDLFTVAVTNAAYLRLVSITNANPDTLTNLSVEVGVKVSRR
jgi:hypothetical protein